MSKENEIFKLDETSALNIADISGSVGCAYWITPNLRYAKKQIMIDEQTCKYELRLQQMWQGQDGSQKWEWVEVVG
jgi:predicted ABC-class ATPase